MEIIPLGETIKEYFEQLVKVWRDVVSKPINGASLEKDADMLKQLIIKLEVASNNNYKFKEFLNFNKSSINNLTKMVDELLYYLAGGLGQEDFILELEEIKNAIKVLIKINLPQYQAVMKKKEEAQDNASTSEQYIRPKTITESSRYAKSYRFHRDLHEKIEATINKIQRYPLRTTGVHEILKAKAYREPNIWSARVNDNFRLLYIWYPERKELLLWDVVPHKVIDSLNRDPKYVSVGP